MDTVVLDRTGKLTLGEPGVTDVIAAMAFSPVTVVGNASRLRRLEL